MTRLLLKLPWFVAAPAIVAVAAVIALVFATQGGPYFERTFRDDADPLAGVGQPASGNPSTAGDESSPSIEPTLPGTPTPAPPTAEAPADEPTATPEEVAGVLAEGTFEDGEPGHNGEGVAKIIRTPEGGLVLRFEGFSVTNGPDLYVVLSTDSDGYSDDNLNLGRLKATDGNVNYEIPAGADLSRFKSAVIWCDRFDTLFAFATLEM